MSTEGKSERNLNRTSDESSGHENSSCVEYPQRAIAILLMKNEAMRFELFAVRQRVERIDQAVFGAGCHNVQKQLPAHLLGILRDLCCGYTRTAQTSTQAASDNIIGFLASRTHRIEE